MNSILQIIIPLLLILIFVQDLKYRAIHIALPLVLFGIGIYVFYTQQREWLWIICNILFLLLTFAGLYLYLMIRNRSLITNISSSIGLGDILFFIAVTPFFGLNNYVLFFIIGLVFSMVCFLFLKRKTQTKLVPLAGLLAMFMLLAMLVDYFVTIDLFFGKIV